MIEVVIDLNEMQRIRGGVNQQRWVNDKLRAAGIPVKGAFSFEGVQHGTMKTNADFVTNRWTFQWTEDTLDKGVEIGDTTS